LELRHIPLTIDETGPYPKRAATKRVQAMCFKRFPDACRRGKIAARFRSMVAIMRRAAKRRPLS
jgi:hypothetical protein